MLIRYGYEITLNCAQPTALVCLLSVHDDHDKAIRVPERVFTTPIIPTTTYRDLYGNQCAGGWWRPPQALGKRQRSDRPFWLPTGRLRSNILVTAPR